MGNVLVTRKKWAWPNEGHVSPQYIEQLRKLVETRAAKQFADWRKPFMV
jgi:hypothetical protein